MIRLKRNFNIYLIGVLLFAIIIVSFIIKATKNNETSYQKTERTVVIDSDNCTISMDMEQFIPLVLMAQMPYDSPKEQLKAQAVVVRTYILYMMGGNKFITTAKLGLPYKSVSQLKELWFTEEKMLYANGLKGAYARLTGMGEGDVYIRKMSYLYKTIRETEGRVLKIEGKVILPLFHLASNGRTRSGKEVLGDKYSYLIATKCDNDMEYKNYENYKELSVKEIFLALNKKGIVIFDDGEEVHGSKLSTNDFLKLLNTQNKDETGYINFFVLGDVKIDGNDFASILGLDSSAMDVYEANGKIAFTTRGIGHGFGMSMNYAKVLAEKGKDYQTILKTFYDVALVKN